MSELGREIFPDGARLQRIGSRSATGSSGQTPAEGARAALRATLEEEAPGAASGRCYTPSRLRRLRGTPHIDDADPRVLDPALGAALWDAAVALTRVEPARNLRPAGSE